ncbi:C40 family peptidase [Streptomyces hygroscopicus]|uniref:C40 family peptidase n=1 Tax=Streptomyces hygroscopicus TaxID=1912 RepID=UPI00223FC48D|nr:C40 family peptidase [Streptomyces hygroscopicus]
MYHDAEVATDAYNAADEKVRKQSKRVAVLTEEDHVVQLRLQRLTAQAGAAARAQYRGGGVPVEVQLMLAGAPGYALDNAAQAVQAQHDTEKLIQALDTAEKSLHTRAADVANELKSLEEIRRQRDAARRDIEERISRARSIEADLKADDKTRLAQLEQRAAADAQNAWLRSGIVKHPSAKASSAGGTAVAYALQQIGKPYVWGAQGPDSFDCSGLTSQAWAAASHPIPRTSQEQWRQLPHVGIEDIRPGDLVIYFDDASHVGMYAGNGSIVHAPRPGRTVTLAPIASMQILGVVRPDA